MLQKNGFINEDEIINDDQTNLFSLENPILASCISASVQNLIALGDRAGQRVQKIGSGMGYWEDTPEFKGQLCCQVNGFTIHANTHVEGHQRACTVGAYGNTPLRYILRPSLSIDRLSLTPEGNVKYALRKAFSDGTTAVVFSPLEFIEKLVALIPMPRANLIRYHGCLAPNSKIRKHVVQKPKENIESDDPTCPEGDDNWKRPYRIEWARLLARVFKFDVEICNLCGGKLKIIAAITQADVIQKILTHLGLSPISPPLIPSQFQWFQC